MLKAYHELECEDLDTISSKVLNFISSELESDKQGWIFLDTKNLLLAVPELMKFFRKLKLTPMTASITVMHNDLAIHIDPPPVVAKINFTCSGGSSRESALYRKDSTRRKPNPRQS